VRALLEKLKLGNIAGQELSGRSKVKIFLGEKLWDC
jgi:hypothetical protein